MRRPWSLAPERVDRSEAGRSRGGVHAEHDPDADGHDDGAERSGNRDDHAGVAELREQHRAQHSEGHAQDPADEAEDRRLDQELAADEAGPGAERLAQPDLTDP